MQVLEHEHYEIQHYDDIPSYVIGTDILDVGAGDCYGAYHSKHRDVFLHNNYLGVDAQSFKTTYLKCVVSDIFDFQTEQKFDTIIMSHILEHFHIEDWEKIFSKILTFLKPNGYLIINVPFRQQKVPHVDNEFMRHKVLHIDEKLLSCYCPFQKFIRCKENGHDRIIFRNSGEPFKKAILRFFYRILTHHKYSILRTFKAPILRLVAIYKKV